MFPPLPARGGGGPLTGASADSSVLDGPPPSPTAMGDDPSAPRAMRGLAPPIPSGQLAPEILTGLTQSAQTIGQLLDQFAQVTPDKATQLALIKDLLQQYLADLMIAGAGPTSPTAAGAAFPGGGIDKGIAGPGSI